MTATRGDGYVYGGGVNRGSVGHWVACPHVPRCIVAALVSRHVANSLKWNARFRVRQLRVAVLVI